jgi:hypothetical protein
MIARLREGRDGILFVLHAEAENHAFYRKLGFEDAADMFRRPRRE